MKFRATALSRQASALGLLIALTGCGDKPTEDIADEAKAAVAEILPGGKTTPSTHFAAVDKNLDQGGIFYGYIDIDGDIARVQDFAQKTMDTLREETGAEIPDVDLEGLISPLGLTDITAMGASSVGTSPELYRNQIFVHTPKGAKGLMTLFGKESSPLLALKSVPAGADIVIEQEFRLDALKEIALGIWEHLPAEAGLPPLDQMMEQSIPNVDMTMGEFISKMNGRALFTASFSDTEKLTLPIDGKEITVPAFDFMLELRELGWIFEKFGPMIPQGGPFQIEESDGVTTLTVQVPPGTPFSTYQPVLIHDKPGNRLILSTNPAYLEACAEGKGDKITSDPSYIALSEGLPTEGNAFSYISPDVKDIVATIVKDAMESEGAPAVASQLVDFVVESLGGVASVTAHRADGIHTIANSAQSLKSSATLGVLAIPAAAMIGMNASRQVAGRAMENEARAADISARRLAEMKNTKAVQEVPARDATEDIAAVVGALKVYSTKNNGTFPDTLTDLVPEFLPSEDALKWSKPNGDLTALVYFSGLTVGAKDNPVLLATPEPDRNGKRTVGRLDGTTEQISEDDFFKAARSAIEQSQ